MATRLILMSVHWSLRFSPFLFLASCFEEEVFEDVLFFDHEREWLSSWVCFEDGEVVVNVFEMISMMKTANGTNWPNSNQISIIFVAESSGSFAEIPPESHEQICFHLGNSKMLMIMYYCNSVLYWGPSLGLFFSHLPFIHLILFINFLWYFIFEQQFLLLTELKMFLHVTSEDAS